MIVAEATWPEIAEFDREAVVVIPTGSLEQHGRHLPLITDSLVVEAVARGAEAIIPGQCLLLPTIWLGESSHHLGYSGSASATPESYLLTLKAIIDCYHRQHRFTKFLILNGHGGNFDLNSISLRSWKAENPNLLLATMGWWELIESEIAQALKGPLKSMSHACETEASVMLHLRPDLVRSEFFRTDGMVPEPNIPGLVTSFQEVSEDGSIGHSQFATAETGRQIFEAAVKATADYVEKLRNGYLLVPRTWE